MKICWLLHLSLFSQIFFRVYPPTQFVTFVYDTSLLFLFLSRLKLFQFPLTENYIYAVLAISLTAFVARKKAECDYKDGDGFFAPDRRTYKKEEVIAATSSTFLFFLAFVH